MTDSNMTILALEQENQVIQANFEEWKALMKAQVVDLKKNLDTAHREMDGLKLHAWVECREGCGNSWCRLHHMHAFECDCTPLGGEDRS